MSSSLRSRLLSALIVFYRHSRLSPFQGEERPMIEARPELLTPVSSEILRDLAA
jgi:hypothetical protein